MASTVHMYNWAHSSAEQIAVTCTQCC